MKQHKIKWAFSLFLILVVVLSLILFGRGTGAKTHISLSATHTGSSFPTLRSYMAAISGLHGVNYYPAMNGWYYMWTNWNATTIDTDFNKISTVLHANYVRIIVPADTYFGYPVPNATTMDELSQTLALADNHNLRVDLTLFDLFSDYKNMTHSKQWLTNVLSSYKDDPRIAFIDLQNELDNTYAPAVAWAKAMIPYAHSLAGNIPITVSLTGGIPGLARQISNGVPVDFYEFHYYLNPAIAYQIFQQALHLIGNTKPLLIGETGYSTIATNTFLDNVSQTQAGQEAEQDQYLRTVEYAAQQSGLPLATPWVYSDFANRANVLPGFLGTDQQYFGLYRSNGTLKSAGTTLSRVFSGNPVDLSFNNGFESCDSTNLPLLWRVYQNTPLGFYANFACDTSTSHTGSGAVRISNGVSSNRGAPGFYLNPVKYIVTGQSYTATVWAKGVNMTGNPQISLAWYGNNNVYLGKNTSSALPRGTTDWTQLFVTAAPPAHAVSVAIYLEVSGTNAGTAWFDDVTFN